MVEDRMSPCRTTTSYGRPADAGRRGYRGRGRSAGRANPAGGAGAAGVHARLRGALQPGDAGGASADERERRSATGCQRFHEMAVTEGGSHESWEEELARRDRLRPYGFAGYPAEITVRCTIEGLSALAPEELEELIDEVPLLGRRAERRVSTIPRCAFPPDRRRAGDPHLPRPDVRVSRW
jgi:hypothetical protein